MLLNWYHKNGRGCNYSMNLKYQYEVGAKTYQGNRFMFGTPPCTPNEAREVAKQVTMGGDVTVYYQADKPSESVLVPGRLNSNTWTGIFFLSAVAPLCTLMSAGLLTGKISLSPKRTRM